MMPNHNTPFSVSIILGNRSNEEYLLIAVHIVDSLGWAVKEVSDDFLQTLTANGEQTIDISFGQNIMHITSYSTDGLLMNEDVNRNNVSLFQSKFESYVIALNEQKQHTLIDGASYDTDAQELHEYEIPEGKQSGGGLWRLFVPNKDFLVTPLISYACIIVFLLMVFSGAGFFEPTGKDLIKWGGDYSPLTLSGDWWRLITSVFVHIGIFHLVLNLFGLIFVAVFLESILGSWRFFVAYMVTGILASLTSVWWHTVILSAGASGAIFGMYGVFLALLASDLIDKNFRKEGLTYFGVVVVLNLVSGMKEGIDNAAHVGGLVSGFIIGYMYYPSLKMPTRVWLKYVTPVLVVILGCGISYYGLKHIPNYMATYNTNISQFNKNEEKALAIFSEMDTVSRERALYLLDTNGIQLWRKNIALIDELQLIPKLPEDYITELKVRRAYSEFRLKNYELRYKAEKENSPLYHDSIVKTDHQIDSIVKAYNSLDSAAKK